MLHANGIPVNLAIDVAHVPGFVPQPAPLFRAEHGRCAITACALETEHAAFVVTHGAEHWLYESDAENEKSHGPPIYRQAQRVARSF